MTVLELIYKKTGVITAVAAPENDRAKLLSLGLLPGALIRKESERTARPIIIKTTADELFALSAPLAETIFIRECSLYE